MSISPFMANREINFKISDMFPTYGKKVNKKSTFINFFYRDSMIHWLSSRKTWKKHYVNVKSWNIIRFSKVCSPIQLQHSLREDWNENKKKSSCRVYLSCSLTVFFFIFRSHSFAKFVLNYEFRFDI